MQDVYDFFYDVNVLLVSKGFQRLDKMLRPAIMSGVLSDMIAASLAKHSRTLVQNRYFNGHPDLIVQGRYPNDAVKAGSRGVEIKTTRKAGGAVDTHGARNQWMLRLRLRDRRRNRASDETTTDGLYRNISEPSHYSGFSEESTRRTGNKNRDFTPTRNRQVTSQLGLPLSSNNTDLGDYHRRTGFVDPAPTLPLQSESKEG